MTKTKYTRNLSKECLVIALLVFQTESFAIDGGKVRRGGSMSDGTRLSAVQSLVPEKTANADPTATSPLSGVPYISVLSGLDALYPPEDLQTRNAVSRTDGYWNFVREGSEPPQHLTYGEFDFYFFAELLDRASHHHCPLSRGWDGKVFADIGSGAGRLVFGAAALHPSFKLCRGIELLPGIHNIALQNLDQCKKDQQPSVPNHNWQSSATYIQSLANATHTHPTSSTCQAQTDHFSLKYSIHSDLHIPSSTFIPTDSELPLAPIHFECGSFEDPSLDLSNIDIAFVFSTCMVEKMSDGLSQAFGRGCKDGTIIITTDYMLPLKGTAEPVEGQPNIPFGPYQLELVEQINGPCWLTGGESTAFIHRVVKSLYNQDKHGPETIFY